VGHIRHEIPLGLLRGLYPCAHLIEGTSQLLYFTWPFKQDRFVFASCECLADLVIRRKGLVTQRAMPSAEKRQQHCPQASLKIMAGISSSRKIWSRGLSDEASQR